MNIRDQFIPQISSQKTFGINICASFDRQILHWHTFYEVELYVDGTSTHIINGVSFHTNPGFLAIFTPGDFHKFQADSDKRLKIKKFIFQDHYLSPELHEILQKRSFPCILQLDEQGLIHFSECFDNLYRIFLNDDSLLKSLKIKNAVEAICIQIIDQANNVPGIIQNNMDSNYRRIDKIHSVIQYIGLHFSEHIQINDVAKVLHQSNNYFSHYFHKILGISFSKYLKLYRIHYAAELLLSTEILVSDICYASGFSSLNFFNKVFRQQYKTSPYQYRMQYKDRHP